MSFTFLFITKGRKSFGRSLMNCLSQLRKFNKIKIIIVDGNKDNRIEKYLTENNLFHKNLSIIKQRKGKFVRACLIALSNLETDFFTFMHDDDYISPNFHELIEFAIKKNSSVIGNGIVLPKKEEKFNFTEIKNYKLFSSKEILNKYFCSIKIENKFLPANPACSVFKKDIADIWKSVLKVVLKNKFISSYIIHKNIGQDLLLYLIALSVQKEIFYCTEYTCQFSSHEDSMSVNFGSHNLGVGYWLAKKIYTRFSGKNFVYKTSFLENINLFIRGLIYCFKQGFNRKKFHFHSNKKLLEQIINYKKIEIDNI